MKDPIQVAKDQVEFEILYERASNIPRCFTELKVYGEMPFRRIMATTPMTNLPKNAFGISDTGKLDDKWCDNFTEAQLRLFATQRERDEIRRRDDFGLKPSFPFEYLNETGCVGRRNDIIVREAGI